VVQLDLPLGLADEARRPGARGGMARLLADHAIDAIRDRFGWESVGYASVALDARRSVPDAFRELAERELRVRPASFRVFVLPRCSSTAAAVTHRFRLCLPENDAVPLSLSELAAAG
jgi:hypothetical protein